MKLSIRELFNAVVEEAVDQHLVLGTEVEELLVVAEDWMEVNSIYTKSNFFVGYIEPSKVYSTPFFPDCYNLERSGYKFFSYRIRDTFTAIDVSDCSRQCGRSYNCQSFAYNR